MVAIAAHEESRVESPWLISPTWDLAALVLVTAASMIPWVMSTRLGISYPYILLFAGLFNGPHLISTLTRVYFLKGERFRRPFHYWVMPLALITYVAVCRASGEGMILLRSTLFYWASWHFVSQSWGILRLYQRKHGVFGTPLATLERALLFGPALFFVARRIFTGPWMLFGMPIIHPRIPGWSVNAIGAAVITVAAVYLWKLSRTDVRARDGLRVLFLCMNAFGFYVPYMLFQDGTTAFAAAATWHAIQYIAIVWQYNRKQYAGRTVDGRGDKLIAWLSQPGRTAIYLLALGVPGFAGYLGIRIVNTVQDFPMESVILTIWSAGTLAHYYLDGVIWKRRRYDLSKLA